MSRKDYELIAQVVYSIVDTDLPFDTSKKPLLAEVREQVAKDFAYRLGKENSRFNQEKFLKACGC